MAGNNSDGENQQRGMSPVDESLQYVEKSPELNRNPESREKEKPFKKKAEVSREKRKTAYQSSSSKTTSVRRATSLKALKPQSPKAWLRAFDTSKSLSSDIAEVISNTGNPSKRSHDYLSTSDSEEDQSPARKVPRGASATDNESVDLSIDSLFPQGSETSKDSEQSEKLSKSTF